MKKLRVGIIGFGNRGFSFAQPLQLPPFNELAEVVAVYDPVQLKREFAQQACHNHVIQCPTRDDLLNEKLDLVMITSPQFCHCDDAVASLKAGFHTFCDKPMACTSNQCRKMIDAERASDKNFFMGFNLRSHPVVTEIMKLINAGELGHLQQQNCIDNFAGGFTFFRRWSRFTKNSGGLTVEKGCHSIDLMNLFAQCHPAKVMAFGGLDRFKPDPEASEFCTECKKAATCPYYYDYDKVAEQVKINTDIDVGYVNAKEKMDFCLFNSEKDTYDNTAILIEYENGCRATLMECFTSSVRQYNDREFMLNGWEGQVWASLNRRTIGFYKNAPNQKAAPYKDIPIPQVDGPHGGADTIMLNYMIDCIKNGTPNNRMVAEAGYYAVAVAEAAEKAIREQRIVNIDKI